MRYCLTPVKRAIIKIQTINAGEAVERREPLYTVGRNVNWYSHYREQCEVFLKKKKKNRATCDPEIPFLHIYLEKNMI